MVPSWVADYIEIPFKDKGRTRAGVDCYGLVRLVLKDRYGKALPEFSDYSSCGASEEVAILVDANIPTIDAKEIDYSDLTPGDLVLIRHMGLPCHIGIYVGGGSILHTAYRKNTVLERLSSPRFKNRVEGFYRVA